jgi:hypothetical protein
MHLLSLQSTGMPATSVAQKRTSINGAAAKFDKYYVCVWVCMCMKAVSHCPLKSGFSYHYQLRFLLFCKCVCFVLLVLLFFMLLSFIFMLF